MVIAAERHLRSRLESVRRRIGTAAVRSGRAPEDITLVAVSKTHPADVVREAIELGVTDLGENRVQEAEAKIIELGRGGPRWHLIGHLQANKARRAVKLFDLIHSLDSAALAQRLERSCVEEDRPELRVLIQVDLAGETTKSGAAVTDLPELVTVVNGCSRLRLSGLMVLPPFFDEPETVRPFFRKLHELRDELKSRGAFGEEPGELSMGMTHDFEVAIEEGATLIRVGTAIFGERERNPAN
jgi:PLP dependent protein